MRIKSYFADSVDSALEKARQELGPDAMLMNSKKTEPDLRALGAYEVIFAAPPNETRSAAGRKRRTNGTRDARAAATDSTGLADSAQQSTSPSAEEDPGLDPEFARELAALRKQIDTVKRSVDRRPAVLGGARALLTGDAAELAARLAVADFSDEMASEIAVIAEKPLSAARRAGAEGPEAFDAALRETLASRLRLAPRLGPARGKHRSTLFAGPAGSGKTTSLVKLAIRTGLLERQPVQILSLDTLRLGGWETLASYARIAGLPFEVVHTIPSLERALTEHRATKAVLIDTPGFSPACMDESTALTDWLRVNPERVETQLVLPASTQSRINQRSIERFALFSPAKLLFTHWDETDTPGPCLEVSLRSGLPLSFLADGQRVPEDIHDADAKRLLECFGPGTARRRQVSAA